jgi:hypothetical protein
MERDSTNIVQEAAYQMDKGIAGVMPATHEVHARLEVAERDLSDEQRDKVLEVSNRVLSKKDMPADRVAEKVIEKLGY